MQEKRDSNPVKPRSSEESVNNFHRNKSKQVGSQQENSAASFSTKSHKDILSTPPPPPPISMDIKQNEISGTSYSQKAQKIPMNRLKFACETNLL